METVSLYDGIVLTVVSMLVVFLVLAAIWGLVELVSKFVSEPETQSELTARPQRAVDQAPKDTLVENPKHIQVAELMALILASEDKPDKKFEIIESKRVK